MHPSDQENTDQLMKKMLERDNIGEFERQFLDHERGNVLRDGVTLDEIFEKAGLRPTEWESLSPVAKAWIQSGRAQGAHGISARPWEKGLGYSMFTNPKEGIWYFLKKTGQNYAWSCMWLDGEEYRIEPMNHNSTLHQIIGTVAYNKFGEKPEPKTETVEETRTKAKKNLRPWEQK